MNIRLNRLLILSALLSRKSAPEAYGSRSPSFGRRDRVCFPGAIHQCRNNK
jgi:hypothetical protein